MDIPWFGYAPLPHWAIMSVLLPTSFHSSIRAIAFSHMSLTVSLQSLPSCKMGGSVRPFASPSPRTKSTITLHPFSGEPGWFWLYSVSPKISYGRFSHQIHAGRTFKGSVRRVGGGRVIRDAWLVRRAVRRGEERRPEVAQLEDDRAETRCYALEFEVERLREASDGVLARAV